MNSKVIIGVPVHNDLESFQSMMSSLVFSTNFYDKIILIESESTDGCDKFCDELCDMNDKIEVIHTKKEGSLKAYNRLFEIAKKEKADLFLTQTDVLFPKLYKKDWLQEMNIIAQNEIVGAVTCIGGGGVSGKDYIAGFNWLGGWCTYVPYRTLEKIGGYDEGFPNAQYGVDVDHTVRIVKSGLKIIQINYWVHHHQMNSREHDNNPDTEKHKQECAKYFRKKWKL